MSLSNSNDQIAKIDGRERHASAPAREPVFWRVEGSLLNLTAVRPVGFFAWNSQSFLERWSAPRRDGRSRRRAPVSLR